VGFISSWKFESSQPHYESPAIGGAFARGGFSWTEPSSVVGFAHSLRHPWAGTALGGQTYDLGAAFARSHRDRVDVFVLVYCFLLKRLLY